MLIQFCAFQDIDSYLCCQSYNHNLALANVYFSDLLTLAFSAQMCFNAFDKAADLDVLDHPILNLIYYLVSLLKILHIEGQFAHVCIVAVAWYVHSTSLVSIRVKFLRNLNMQLILRAECFLNSCSQHVLLQLF